MRYAVTVQGSDLLDVVRARPPRRLCVSFSGGETSAFMALWILRYWRDRYDEIVTVFANTSAEDERTLIFVEQVDRAFGLGVTWVEAALSPRVGEGVTARVVDFATAHRAGEVFEPMIAKYGIPNKAFPFCSKYLKRRAIENYLRSIGWKRNTYDLAIGIRADEFDRMSAGDPDVRPVYPLVGAGITKPMINSFWSRLPFRLGLKSYEGNCVWCWKKSLRKHMTLIIERPEIYDFPRRMEALYSDRGPEFRKPDDPPPPGYRRRFFRESNSTDELFAKAANLPATFTPAADDAVVFDPDLDVGEGCDESCEVF